MQDHESALIRQTWKHEGKVHHHTIASLTHLPKQQIDGIEAVLNHGANPGASINDVKVHDGLTHGAVAAAWVKATQLGLPDLLGPEGRDRDIALALIISRLVNPASKTTTISWWNNTTLGHDLGLADVTPDEVYQAMDHLVKRQDQIEAGLVARWLKDPVANPTRMALFDLTSTWVEGTHCDLADFGYSRDQKKGHRQVEFALLASPDGIPVAVRVFKGNTSDPASFTSAITAIADQFQISDAIMVGDRGMITDARIDDVKAQHLDWITAARHATIAQLAEATSNDFQPSLLDDWGLVEFIDPAYPGERLIACKNPVLADYSKAKRDRLITAALDALQPLFNQVGAGRIKDPAIIGKRAGKATAKYQMDKYLTITIDRGWIQAGRDTVALRQAEVLDGIYLVRTSLTPEVMPTEEAVRSYKMLANIEKDFALCKDDDMIRIRPIFHHRSDRVKAHLLICMLACHLAWHLAKAWAPITFTDTQPKDPNRDPVKPQQRSDQAKHKTHRSSRGQVLAPMALPALICHLGLMQRVIIDVSTGTPGAKPVSLTRVAEPTPMQAEAFRLLGAPIPAALTPPKQGRQKTATTRQPVQA